MSDSATPSTSLASVAGRLATSAAPASRPLAYPFPTRPVEPRWGSDRRKTVAIPINGLFYEVGPDVMLAADAFRATQIHDDYTDTPEYLALAARVRCA
jgi:hypothetical protein